MSTGADGQTNWKIELPSKGYEVGETLSDYSVFSNYIHQGFRRFVGGLSEECDVEGIRERLAGRGFTQEMIPTNPAGRLLDADLDREDPCALLVFPDHSRMLIGRDKTARDSGLFGFVVKRDQPPFPTPDTCEEALDLLKPREVKERLAKDPGSVSRQGEWWILPANEEPVGQVHKPGVSARPFGASPLDNHVPREYALGVPDDEFVARFKEQVPEVADYYDTVPGIIEWINKQHEFAGDDMIEIPDHVPTLIHARQWAEGIYVRGTLRHRHNDHFLENIGEEWHITMTHDIDVYTADIMPDAALSPRLD